MDDDQNEAEKRRQEEAAYKALNEKRIKEENERKRKQEEEKRAEERKRREEDQRRKEEEIRRRKQEEEWKKLGSDKIVKLPAPPPSFVDDNDPNAMKAWLLDEETSKPQYRVLSLKPGKLLDAPPQTLLSLRELGIVYYRINLNDFTLINQIVQERKYKHTDEIKVSQTCKDEGFLEKWFVEHFVEDEQIRLITDGSCYLDVRSKQDTWIRLSLQAGDLVVVPPGMYHRGTLDESDYCAVMRVFKDSQRWNPIYRNEKRADNHPSRLQYLRWIKKSNVAAELGFK